MTRTGYSCAFMRRKSKPGCPSTINHWCSEFCKFIDPMTCQAECYKFRILADLHRRSIPKMEVELL